MKNKSLKKLTSFVMMFVFALSSVSVAGVPAAVAEEGNGTSSDGTETSPTNQMLHFIMKVRWGNVIDNSTDLSSPEANFDGSVNVTDAARVSLQRSVLFEKHNETADKITERKNPVSWNSLIYRHYDGVKVAISSPAGDDVTITTTQGSVTMTAQALYDLSESYVKDVEEGREIVIETYPVKNPRYFLRVVWGKTSRAEYALKGEADEIESNAVMIGNALKKAVKNQFGKDINVYDASGYFQIDNGGVLKFIKTLRFEGSDEITLNSEGKIEWTSHVAQGVDGILVELDLDADSLADSDTITLGFDEVADDEGTGNWSESFNIMDLYHNRVTKVDVKGEYGATLQVWQKPNKSLIRVRNTQTVYVVEDGVKRPIPSPAVLRSQGLSFGNISEVDQSEADTYGDGNAICYADGTMVRERNRNEVYVIANGEKKHITDPASFAALGYNWRNVIEVESGVLGLYRNRTAMQSNSVHPEGALIREEGTNTVYLVEGGKKKPISSLNIFDARRLNWDKVLVVNDVQMKKFQLGANLQYPDGALVKNQAGKVYRINQGKKQWIRSGEDLAGAGYKAEDIINITDATELSDLAEIVEDEDLFAEDGIIGS